VADTAAGADTAADADTAAGADIGPAAEPASPPGRRGPASGDGLLRLLADTLSARGLLGLCGFANVAIVSRAAGVEVYGVYGAAMAFATLLMFVTDLGASAVVVREAVDARNRPLVARTYVQVRLLLIVATTAVSAAVVPLAFPPSARGSAWLALGMLVFSGAAVISPLGQIYGTMKVYRRTAVLQGVLSLAFTVVVVRADPHPTAFALVGSTVAAAAITTVFAALAVRRWVAAVWSGVDWPAVRLMGRSISVLGLALAAGAVYDRIDSILLLRLAGETETGYYVAAYRLLDQTSMIPAALLVPLGPLIVRQIGRYRRVLPPVDRSLNRLALSAGMGLALGTMGASAWVASIVLGSVSAPAGQLLTILAISRSWVVVAYVATAKLVHGHRERRQLAVALSAVALNVGLNLVLIPRFGATGAAVATIATEALTVAFFVTGVRPLSGVRVGGRVAAAGVAAAAVALVSLRLEDPAARAALNGICVVVGAALVVRAGLLMRRIEATAALAGDPTDLTGAS
jgi:O-antigen/teichoic acid export membrane protein